MRERLLIAPASRRSCIEFGRNEIALCSSTVNQSSAISGSPTTERPFETPPHIRSSASLKQQRKGGGRGEARKRQVSRRRFIKYSFHKISTVSPSDCPSPHNIITTYEDTKVDKQEREWSSSSSSSLGTEKDL